MEHISLIKQQNVDDVKIEKKNHQDSYKTILCLFSYLLGDKPIKEKCYDNVLPR